MKGSDGVILATDPDREGEAISWHVQDELHAPQGHLTGMSVKRVTFNAITKNAVLEAMRASAPTSISSWWTPTSPAALDYLVGFTLSPVLWRGAAGLEVRGPRAVGRLAPDLRPRAGDRGVQGGRILDRRRRYEHRTSPKNSSRA